MPTTKKRVNISLPKELEHFLERIAKRDNIPVATKASELLTRALELEEDFYLSAVGEERLATQTLLISHEDVWT